MTLKNGSKEINIVQSHLTRKISRLKSPRTPRYLVIHYTAGASSAPGRAQRTRDNWQTSDRQASADFVVDDATILQANPDIKNYYCWAVGDGKGAYGITNTNSISIEMCSTIKAGTSAQKANHSGWSITPAVRQNTLKLAAYLMRKYNIGIDRVVRHYDASRKYCPGIVGWNPGTLCNPDGTCSKDKNNETEWEKFKLELATIV